MRTGIAILSCLLVLAACGGDDLDAVKSNKAKLEKQLQALNAELAEKLGTWGPIRDKVIPAQSAWLRAKKSGDADAMATAKAALEEAQAASNEAIQLEKALKDRIRDLKDKIAALEKKLR